jgi:NTP pyrophosphatase (non-canonical NTP hydrolase)
MTTTITLDEAKLQVEQGKKVCHRYFTPNEYIMKHPTIGGKLLMEDGVMTSWDELMRDRRHLDWFEGWEIFQEETYEAKQSKVLTAIGEEVRRAKKVFPENFHNQHEAYGVLLEEVDELWDEIKKNQRNYDLDAQRKEATQAAAMLVRLLVELL